MRLSLALLLTLPLVASAALPVSAAEFDYYDEAPVNDAVEYDAASHDTASSCDACSDESLCDCCCPASLWTGRVGYLHMWRERIGSDFAVWEDTADNPFYTADRFDFDPKSGLEASLSWDNGCGKGWEFRYFGLEDYVASENVANGSNTRPATNPNTSFSITGGRLDFDYESELQSFELLRTHRCGKARLTYGFRYVDLDETMTATWLVNDNTVLVRAQNRLYGLETGLDGILWDNGCRLKLEGAARAGLYFNDVEASTNSIFSVGRSGQATSDQAAFIGELGLNASYDVSCHWSLRAGYQLMLIDGVALAADQVPNTGGLGIANPNPAPINIDSSSLLYHGLNVGLEYRR